MMKALTQNALLQSIKYCWDGVAGRYLWDVLGPWHHGSQVLSHAPPH